MRCIEVYSAIFISDMDINKIFDLFDSSSKDELIKDKNAVVNDLKEHPAYWLGMYKKLIFNYKVFRKKITFYLEQMDMKGDLDILGDNLAFERAWFYINKFNPELELHKDSITLILDDILLKTLEDGIKHFQELEEYERCAHIKKVLDEVKILLK